MLRRNDYLSPKLTDQEVEDVVAYLNATYYGFPVQRTADREYRASRPAFEVIRQPNGPTQVEKLHSSQAPMPENRFQGSAHSRYSNPEFDKIIDEEQMIADPKKRLGLLQQAGKILMDDVPYVPLYNLASIYGAARNLAWKMRPDEKVLGWDMRIV